MNTWLPTPSINSSIVGGVDHWSPTIEGWAYDSSNPDSPLEISIFVDGEEVTRVFCDLVREDVKQAGNATSQCGFTIPMPEFVQDHHSHEVAILATQSGEEIFTSGRPVYFRSPSPYIDLGPFAQNTVRERLFDWDSVSQKLILSGRLAIVASYRTVGASRESLIWLIRSLQAENIAVVVIDTSDKFDGNKLGADCYIWRDNLGHDFASWLTGYNEIRSLLPKISELIFTNDSCFGPFGGLGKLFRRSQDIKADVWSVTDSYEISYHLQSYFLVFRKSALDTGVLDEFGSNYQYSSIKQRVVIDGEIGLSKLLIQRSLSIAPVFPYTELARRFLKGSRRKIRESQKLYLTRSLRSSPVVFISNKTTEVVEQIEDVSNGVSYNPTHLFWQELIESGSPFIKRDLLHRNPANIVDIGIALNKLKKVASNSEMKLIREDLISRQATVPLL